MKKVIFAVLTVAALTSCSSKFDVKLNNGSVVKAVDRNDREFKAGDVVCVNGPTFYGDDWQINTAGDMQDTLYFRQFIKSNGDTAGYWVERRIGIIR